MSTQLRPKNGTRPPLKKQTRDVAQVSAVVLEQPHAPSWCDAHITAEGKIMVEREIDDLAKIKLPVVIAETYAPGACTHQFGHTRLLFDSCFKKCVSGTLAFLDKQRRKLTDKKKSGSPSSLSQRKAGPFLRGRVPRRRRYRGPKSRS